MKFTDTHCHLADNALYPQLEQVLHEAAAAGVCRFIVPSAHSGDWMRVAKLAQMSAHSIHAAFGIHPWFADQVSENDLADLETMLQTHSNAWLGEIGLDFYGKYGGSETRKQQISIFIAQLELAKSLQRPVIIHNLRATEAIRQAIVQTRFTLGGIVHAFSGSLEEAKILIGLDFKIGIGSLLLNPNARKVRDAVSHLDLEYLVLETDSPFMLKEAINTPVNILKIAETAAALRGITLEELSEQTERNVDKLFSTM